MFSLSELYLGLLNIFWGQNEQGVEYWSPKLNTGNRGLNTGQADPSFQGDLSLKRKAESIIF